MIDRNSVIVRTGDLVSAPMGDELAMMDMVSGSYFVLDKVAAAIWEAIERPVAVRALCARLGEQFDVPEGRCEADVIPFLEKLALKNLVRVGGGD
jgi:Coenzyme PQQ synthesis protein D (PqqD)